MFVKTSSKPTELQIPSMTSRFSKLHNEEGKNHLCRLRIGVIRVVVPYPETVALQLQTVIGMEFLIRFAQVHETFRLPEIEALATLNGIEFELLSYDKYVRTSFVAVFKNFFFSPKSVRIQREVHNPCSHYYFNTVSL
jgi:hypothetical protein